MPLRVFKAWIPTVTGALSFSAFGEASHPPRAISVNRADARHRYLVSYQRRDTSDVLLPFRRLLGPRLFYTHGDFWFLCIGKSVPGENADQEFFEGRLFLFCEKQVWRGNAEHRVRHLQDILSAYDSRKVKKPIGQYFDTRYGFALEDLSPISSFYCDFSLTRSGNLTLSVNLPDLTSGSWADGPFSADSEERHHQVSRVMSQMFFFLRDILHRHQHHDPQTDTIVDVREAYDTDDLSWRQHTLFGLYRHIIRYKRSYRGSTFDDALGVSAYARTFKAICKKELKSSLFRKIPDFRSFELEKSISAIQERSRKTLADSANKNTLAATIIISILGLIISFLSLLQIAKVEIADPDPRVVAFATWIIRNAEVSLFGFSFVIIVVLMAFGVFEGRATRIRINFDRLLQGFSRETNIAIRLVLSATIFGSIICLGRYYHFFGI